MAWLKYKNRKKPVEAEIRIVAVHVVRIIPKLEEGQEYPPINTTGFDLFLDEDMKYPLASDEYHGYRTLYRTGEGWHELSNNESVYQEPAPVEPEQLTPEELAEQERQKHISSLNIQLNSLKEQLSSSDYKIIKAYEYSLVGDDAGYDMDSLHKERQQLRDAINAVKEEIEEMNEGGQTDAG